MIIGAKNGNQFEIKILGINHVIKSILWEEKNELFFSSIYKENGIEYCIIHGQNLPLNIALKSR